MSVRAPIPPPAVAGLVCSMLVLFGVGLLSPAPARAQASCPNEAAREREVHGLGLPDCRSYEQVSPVEKGEVEAIGFPGLVQASRSGDRVRYFSATAFNECENSDGSPYPYYVSSRASGGGWSTACVSAGKVAFSEELLETPLSGRAELAGFAADEQQLIFETEEQLLTGAVAHAPNVYEQDLQAPAGKQLTLVGLVPPAGHESCSGLECEVSPAGAVAGAGQNGELDAGAPQGGSHYTQSAISADGSRVFFTALPSGRIYLREDAQKTVQVSPGPAVFREATPEGEFVFYSEGEDLYRFDTSTETSEPVAQPVTATGTGDLTKGSDEITEVAQAAGVFRVGEFISGPGVPDDARIKAVGPHSLVIGESRPGEPQETIAGDQLTGSPGAVLGVLGASADGSTVYFAAAGVVAENAREYEYVNAQGEHEHASETAANEPDLRQTGGVANLYEWYQPPTGAPVTTFIARLFNAGDEELENAGDELDWSGFRAEDSPAPKESRVTPDGQTLLFSSELSLTGYDNSGPCAPRSACREFYRYSAGAGGSVGRLSCVSCNSDPAQAPLGDAQLAGEGGSSSIAASGERLLPRNLSEDGSRVFFDSPDSLVAGVASSLTSVYEWEAPASQSELEKAENSCTSSSLSFHASDEGCLFLISSGIDGAYFGDASANGGDVFFFTAQQLAPSDDDEVADVYDASVNGEGCGAPGYPECHPEPKPVPQCRSERECEPPPPGAPVEPSPASSAFSGPGNLITPPPPGETPVAKPAGKPLTNAQKLTKALKACHKDKRKSKRTSCERTARKKYGAKASARRASRKAHR